MTGRRDTSRTRGQRGETLAETLAAILVCTLASVMMLTAIVSAANINTAAKKRDATIQEAEQSAASQLAGSVDKSTTGTVTFTANGSTTSYNVYYSTGNDVVSYVDKNL